MKRISALLALLVASLGFGVVLASAGPGPSVVYNAIPKPLPSNVASLGFEATQTSEFGDRVTLGGTDRVLKTVTVTMSDWALYSDYSADARYSANNKTWKHPVTINVYDGSSLDSNGVPDTLLGTVTKTIDIPWRPAADPTCPDTGYGAGFAWRAGDGLCYNGKAFNAVFDFSSQNVTLPDDVIVGVAYNTGDYGSAPIGSAGPYNSLNVGVPTGQTASVGTDNNSDNVFWNTSTASNYTDGGAGGVGVFREDTNWGTNGTVAFQITAVPPKPCKKHC